MIPYKDLFHPNRDDNTIVAYRKNEALTLADLQNKILEISSIIKKNSHLDNWAICLEDSFLFAASLFALIINNKIPIILGHLREAQIKEQSSFYNAILSDINLTIDDRLVFHIETKILPYAPEEDDWFNFSEHAYLLLFTSGSTAKPKAIKKPFNLLEKESILLSQEFANTFSGKTVVSTVSHLHLYGITFKILLPLVLETPFKVEQIYFQEELPKTQQDHILITSPAFLKRLDKNLKSSAFSEIFSSGGLLPFEHAKLSQQILGITPTEIYGSSETGGIARRKQQSPSSLFCPFDSITISVDENSLIQVDSPLFMPSDQIALNDIIEIQPEGFILKGRVGKTIKIEEKRISLTEVEARLLSIKEIKEAIVFPMENNNRTILAAIIVLSDVADVKNEFLFFNLIKQNLKEWLEPVAIPKRWRIVKELPQNPQGKFSYYDLKALFL